MRNKPALRTTLLFRRVLRTTKWNFCWILACGLALGGCLLTALPLAAASNPDELYRKGDYRLAQKLYGELDLKHPQTVRYRYNRGCAAYQAGDYQAASAAFKSSLTRATDDELRYRCNFNLGNTAFKQGDLTAAAAYYRQALRLRPADESLQANLELALKQIERERRQNKGGQRNKPQAGQQPISPQPGQNGQQPQPGQSPAQNQAQNKNAQANQPKAGQPQPNQAANPNQPQPGQGQNPAQQPASAQTNQPRTGQIGSARAGQSGLDRQRADALIESVRENRPRRGQTDGLPASGKYW